jgi:hypothetical protein
MKWQANRKIIPPQETQHESVLNKHSSKPAERDAELAKSLIGATLHQMSSIAQFAVSLERAAQSSLVTPKMVEAWSYALWEMVNLTMSTCDLLRTLVPTYSLSPQTSPSLEEIEFFLRKADEFCDGIVNEFDL